MFCSLEVNIQMRVSRCRFNVVLSILVGIKNNNILMFTEVVRAYLIDKVRLDWNYYVGIVLTVVCFTEHEWVFLYYIIISSI